MRHKARTLGWLVTPFFLLAAACGSSGDKPPTSVDDSPSVILISIDTLRADKLGCYGYRERETSPSIDALAADGVLFENFITSSPWTTPAHLSMLTALYPTTHGLTASFKEVKRDIQRKGKHHFFKLPESRVTLAEALKESGFATAAFTGGVTMAPMLGFDQGFDRYDSSMFKLDERNVGRMLDWIRGQRGRKFFLFWHTFEVHAPYLDTRFLRDVVHGRQGRKLAFQLLAATGKPRGGLDRLGKRANSQRHRQMEVLKESGRFYPKVCEALYTGGIRSMDTWF
ncbi:MAG: sulfatase-like hydrolase/transferase, partial [Deltaproteobacteria bacterium]|nr:sulfatase-like hydrolase/transferase [Deltaproteobacteria bacterium]